MKVAPNELGEKYFIQNYETDDKYDIVGVHTKIRDKHSIFIEEWNKDYHQGAYIDIFIMNQFKNNDIIYKIQKEFYRMQSISLLPISQFDSFSKRNLKKILKIIFLRLDNQKLIRKLEKKDLNHKQEGDMFSYSFSTPMSIKYQFSEKDIFPLQRSEYEGHQFLIPKNSDKILRCLFNDYMKIPDESNRHGHALFFAIKNQQKNNT